MGNRATNLIKKRTREGFGVENGQPVKFAPLAPSTIRKRQTKTLSSKTSPRTSNLTETGQMVDSLKWRVENNKIVIFFTNDSSSNKETYARVGSNNRPARPFADLTDEELRKLIIFYHQQIKS